MTTITCKFKNLVEPSMSGVVEDDQIAHVDLESGIEVAEEVMEGSIEASDHVDTELQNQAVTR